MVYIYARDHDMRDLRLARICQARVTAFARINLTPRFLLSTIFPKDLIG